MPESAEKIKNRILEIAGKYSLVNTLLKKGNNETKISLAELINELLDGEYTLDKKIVLEYIISNILLTYPQYSDLMSNIRRKLRTNNSNSFSNKNLIKATHIFIKQRMLDNVNKSTSSSASSSASASMTENLSASSSSSITENSSASSSSSSIPVTSEVTVNNPVTSKGIFRFNPNELIKKRKILNSTDRNKLISKLSVNTRKKLNSGISINNILKHISKNNSDSNLLINIQKINDKITKTLKKTENPSPALTQLQKELKNKFKGKIENITNINKELQKKYKNLINSKKSHKNSIEQLQSEINSLSNNNPQNRKRNRQYSLDKIIKEKSQSPIEPKYMKLMSKSISQVIEQLLSNKLSRNNIKNKLKKFYGNNSSIELRNKFKNYKNNKKLDKLIDNISKKFKNLNLLEKTTNPTPIASSTPPPIASLTTTINPTPITSNPNIKSKSKNLSNKLKQITNLLEQNGGVKLTQGKLNIIIELLKNESNNNNYTKHQKKEILSLFKKFQVNTDINQQKLTNIKSEISRVKGELNAIHSSTNQSNLKNKLKVKSILGLPIIDGTQYKTINSTKVYACVGDITKFRGNAIVNAANEGCLGGGGIDGAITSAGGDELEKARLALPIWNKNSSNKYIKTNKRSTNKNDVRCPTGSAVITIGGNLQADYVIHAVGPNYSKITNDKYNAYDELLKSAYRDVLLKAGEKGIKSIAFCLLSAGIFVGKRGMDKIIEIGVNTIVETLKSNNHGLDYVCICGFNNGNESTRTDTILRDVFNRVNGVNVEKIGNSSGTASGITSETASGITSGITSGNKSVIAKESVPVIASETIPVNTSGIESGNASVNSLETEQVNILKNIKNILYKNRKITENNKKNINNILSILGLNADSKLNEVIFNGNGTIKKLSSTSSRIAFGTIIITILDKKTVNIYIVMDNENDEVSAINLLKNNTLENITTISNPLSTIFYYIDPTDKSLEIVNSIKSIKSATKIQRKFKDIKDKKNYDNFLKKDRNFILKKNSLIKRYNKYYFVYGFIIDNNKIYIVIYNTYEYLIVNSNNFNYELVEKDTENYKKSFNILKKKFKSNKNFYEKFKHIKNINKNINKNISIKVIYKDGKCTFTKTLNPSAKEFTLTPTKPLNSSYINTTTIPLPSNTPLKQGMVLYKKDKTLLYIIKKNNNNVNSSNIEVLNPKNNSVLTIPRNSLTNYNLYKYTYKSLAKINPLEEVN